MLLVRGVLVRFLQTNRTNRIYRYQRGDLLLELAHTVAKAEKSYNLPSANWRTGKVSGVGLRSKEADSVTLRLRLTV